MGFQVCPRFRSTQSIKWATLFKANPVIILLQVNKTLNNLHYIVLDLWKDFQTSPSNRENQNFGTVKRIFVGTIWLELFVKQNSLIYSWRFLKSNTSEQLEFNLEKIIGSYKHEGKVRKEDFYNEKNSHLQATKSK
jgi:hypothetical protein